MNGLRVLVAGSSGGIGAACAELLRERGARVCAVDRPGTDVCAPGGAEEAVKRACGELGGVDGVVHAVGMSGRRLGDGPLEDCTDEAWEELLRVNLTSAMRLLRAALPELRRAGGGSVVLVGSALAHRRDAGFHTAGYAVTKAALEALARFAAYEGARDGVRVNVAAPGLVDTPMARRALTDPEMVARFDELMPLGGTPCTAREVAETVVWLLSEESARVSGARVPVDGGWTL